MSSLLVPLVIDLRLPTLETGVLRFCHLKSYSIIYNLLCIIWWEIAPTHSSVIKLFRQNIADAKFKDMN